MRITTNHNAIRHKALSINILFSLRNEIFTEETVNLHFDGEMLYSMQMVSGARTLTHGDVSQKLLLWRGMT